MTMSKKRQIKIYFESGEKTVIRFRRNSAAHVFCRECRETVAHFSVEQAALILSLSGAAVFRLAEFGQIHTTETASGVLLVCGNSLTVLAQKINSVGGRI